MFVTNQHKRLFILCSALHENLHLIKKASIFVSYVIKQLVHAFSCAYIGLWMHSGSLESTKEARVALGYALSSSYASRVFSKLESIHNVIYAPIIWYTLAKHGWILKFRIEKHCLVKRLVFLKNVWDQYSNCRASSKLMFFYKLLIGPQATFLECIVIFLQSDSSALFKRP